MITILDFYVDEPACLGVPPYLAPYCRYIAGSLLHLGIPAEKITYQTVDQWRTRKRERIQSELIIVVAGFTVPGKYLGGKIGTASELIEFLQIRQADFRKGITLVGGPIKFAPKSIQAGITRNGGILINGDIELAIFQLLSYSRKLGLNFSKIKDLESVNSRGSFRSNEQIGEWATAGSFITGQHPNFPYLVNELETYRGCTRRIKCSFCTEVFYGEPHFRKQEDIINEVRSLYDHGNRYFRLGRQADLLTYGADCSRYRSGFPTPDPSQIEKLYCGIRDVAPDLKMLHLDNINPGLIASFPDKALKILDIISQYNTPGDTAAMGLESVDEIVYKVNGLKCNSREALKAIEIVNEAGAKRIGGIPKLLPGLNFIHGLPGETDQTFRRNYEFLLEVLGKGLLLRRINIRQITVHHNTRVEKLLENSDHLKEMGVSFKKQKSSILEKKFLYYRDKIRKEIDKLMLEKVFPRGTVFKELIPETQNLGYVFGRQLGSYPVTVKIPIADSNAMEALNGKKPLDIMVTGYNERSVNGISYPIQINKLGQKALSQIPGIGKKRATTLFLNQPISNMDELKKVIDGPVWGEAKDYIF